MPHPLPGQQPVHFIDNDAALQQCLQHLYQRPSIALDLEFDSHNHAYGVTLCLIQVGTPNESYVIDPFSGIDLVTLYTLFEDARIQKIVHAPGEDLRLLHSLKCYPKNLFDTEIVARLLNYEQTSISVLLQEKLGHAMSKQQQKSNWLRRPLSASQISYAADDVAYLHALKTALVAEAEPKHLMPFVLEEQAALSTTIYKIEPKENFLKAADAHTLSPKDQYILNNLFQYRDELAKRLNKPAHHVMDEATVRAIADGTLSLKNLADERSAHRALKTTQGIDQLAQRLLESNARASALGLGTKMPGREQLTAEQYAAKEKAARDRTQKFLPIQQALAAQMGVFAARFIFSNTAVNDLLMRKITLKDLRPYRRAMLLSLAAAAGIDITEYDA